MARNWNTSRTSSHFHPQKTLIFNRKRRDSDTLEETTDSFQWRNHMGLSWSHGFLRPSYHSLATFSQLNISRRRFAEDRKLKLSWDEADEKIIQIRVRLSLLNKSNRSQRVPTNGDYLTTMKIARKNRGRSKECLTVKVNFTDLTSKVCFWIGQFCCKNRSKSGCLYFISNILSQLILTTCSLR